MEKEVFKAGKWTDSSGRTRSFSEADIDQIVASFNEKTGRNSQGRNVPLFIGHPSGEAPAYGWVEKVWRQGKSMFAKFKDIPKKMKSALDDKAFKDVSISLDGIKGHVLQHIGLTNMPAVAGLAGFEFNLNQLPEGAVQYSTELNKPLEDEASGILTWLKGKFKKEQEDYSTNQQEIEKMSEEKKLQVEVNDLKASFADLERKIVTLETEKKEAVENFEAEKKAHSELKAEIERKATETKDNEELSFVDGIIKAKKMRPADKELHLHVLKSLRDSKEADFTAADGSTEKRNAYADYKQRLLDSPELSEYEDMGKGVEKKDAIEDAVEKIQNEFPNYSHSQALSEVWKRYPELTTQA